MRFSLTPWSRVDVTSAKKRRPAYVSSRNFAQALIQILRKKGEASADPPAKEGDDREKAMRDLTRGVELFTADTPAGEQLKGMLEQSHGSVAGFRTAAERWFDDGMDRVSGWYRNWVQIMTCVFALVIAVGLNVDTIRIAERIRDDTALKTAVVSQAEATVAPAEGEGEEPKDGGAGAEATLEEAGKDTEGAIDKIKGLNLPILWDEANDNVTVNTAFGWLITFLALSLGAPFWFDALSRLARLRKTGVVPEKAK